MLKPKTYTMKEANAVGISRMVRDAEEGPLVVLRRNGVDVAVIFPVTLRGIENIRRVFEELIAAADPQKIQDKFKDNPDLAMVVRFFAERFMPEIQRSLAEKVRAEDSATVGTDTSAVSKGDTGRRRKKPAAGS